MADQFDNLSSKQLRKLIRENRRVIVYFTSRSCGPCKQLTPLFEKKRTSGKYSSVIFVKMNVSKSEAVREASDDYRIDALPTVLIFLNGEQVDRLEGLDLDQFKKMCRKIRNSD